MADKGAAVVPSGVVIDVAVSVNLLTTDGSPQFLFKVEKRVTETAVVGVDQLSSALQSGFLMRITLA